MHHKTILDSTAVSQSSSTTGSQYQYQAQQQKDQTKQDAIITNPLPDFHSTPITLPKFCIAPENRPLEKEIPSEHHNF